MIKGCNKPVFDMVKNVLCGQKGYKDIVLYCNNCKTPQVTDSSNEVATGTQAEKGETLSSKAVFRNIKGAGKGFIHFEDVKEFIKKLKESDKPFQWLSGGCNEESCREDWKEYLDELAGKELTE